MSATKKRIRNFPFHLILIGISLGYLARMVYPPRTEVIAPRIFLPSTENMEGTDKESSEGFTDLPLIN